MPTKTIKSSTKAATAKPSVKAKPGIKTSLPASPKKAAVNASADTRHPLEGKPAPAFSLTAQNGQTVSLKDLTARGHLVLYFYPKDLTPGCTTEACDFRDNLNRLIKLDAVVLGVSKDSPERHRKFKK